MSDDLKQDLIACCAHFRSLAGKLHATGKIGPDSRDAAKRIADEMEARIKRSYIREVPRKKTERYEAEQFTLPLNENHTD